MRHNTPRTEDIMPKQSLHLINYIKELNTTVLHCLPEKQEALAKEITAKIDNFIKKEDISLASVDTQGKTALMYAAELGNFIAVDHLCKWNVTNWAANYPDINAVSHDGISALGYGVRYKDIDDSNESKQEEKKSTDVPATQITERKKFIVKRLVDDNKANYTAYDIRKDKPTIKSHVLALASAAGNLRFIQQKYRDVSIFKFEPGHITSYFLPQAMLGGLQVFQHWLDTLRWNLNTSGRTPTTDTHLFKQAVQTNDLKIVSVLKSGTYRPNLSITHQDFVRTVLACEGTQILEYILTFPPEKIEPLHSFYLLEIIQSGGNLEQVKRVVELAIKAKIFATKKDAIFGAAFAIACQRGYIEVVKEILRLEPIFSSEQLPVPPKEYNEKCKRTRENERVLYFLAAIAEIKAFGRTFNAATLKSFPLSKVNTDDLECISSYLELDYTAEDNLKLAIRQEMVKRHQAEEVKETNTSMSSASELKQDPSSQAIQSVSFGEDTTSPTAPQQEGIPSMLSGNSNLYPVVMSFSPESFAQIPPPAYALSSEIVQSNNDVFTVVKNPPQAVMTNVVMTPENIKTPSPLANNAIIPVATAPEPQATQVAEIKMEQNPDEKDSVQRKLSSPRQSLSLFQAAPVQSAAEKEMENFIFMVQHGLKQLDILAVQNPALAQAMEDRLQAVLEQRTQLRNTL
jgi:hypothetical protein